MTESQAWSLIPQGHDKAEDFLCRKYLDIATRLVGFHAKSNNISISDSDEMTSLGYKSLLTAIRKYNATKGAAFSTYLGMTIKRDVGHFRLGTTRKGRDQFIPISQVAPLGFSGTDNEYLDNIVKPESVKKELPATPEEFQRALRFLTPRERKVVKLMLAENTNTDIAKSIKCSLSTRARIYAIAQEKILQKIQDGRDYQSQVSTRENLPRNFDMDKKYLNPREIEVLSLFMYDMKSELQISKILGIAKCTVNTVKNDGLYKLRALANPGHRDFWLWQHKFVKEMPRSVKLASDRFGEHVKRTHFPDEQDINERAFSVVSKFF